MAHQFPRGFKRSCEQIVAQVRSDLGVRAAKPVDMDELADHLCIPMRSLGELVAEAGFSANDPHVTQSYAKVSAITVFKGRRRHFVYNERHSYPRHRSNLAHEFGHALLLHPPEGESASRAQDRAHEAEAAWFGGVLMLPDFQALDVARTGMPVDEATEQYELSREMLIFRLRATGALKRFPKYLAAA